jgi:hypothetical protein
LYRLSRCCPKAGSKILIGEKAANGFRERAFLSERNE